MSLQNQAEALSSVQAAATLLRRLKIGSRGQLCLHIPSYLFSGGLLGFWVNYYSCPQAVLEITIYLGTWASGRSEQVKDWRPPSINSLSVSTQEVRKLPLQETLKAF